MKRKEGGQTDRCDLLCFISFWRNTDNWILEIVARHLKPVSKSLFARLEKCSIFRVWWPYIIKWFLSSRPQLLTTGWAWGKKENSQQFKKIYQKLLKLLKTTNTEICMPFFFFNNLIVQRKISTSSAHYFLSNSYRIKTTEKKKRGHRLAKRHIFKHKV